jgi:signal transduction histidine kinase
MPAEKNATASQSTAQAIPLDDHVQRLMRRIEELQRDHSAAEDFAALAAHEVIAPLVMTEACVALAREQLDPAHGAELLHALELLGRGARRTRWLVEALLFDARSEGRPLGRAPVDLGELAGECVELLRPEIVAAEAEVTLGALPTVPGEEAMLNGVLMNLLVNALKYSPGPGNAISITSERIGQHWTVSVEGQGTPIPLEDRVRIFQPFERGRSERHVKGAGLGLAVCRRIIERHGGRIGVAPTADGNRFFFTLPA